MPDLQELDILFKYSDEKLNYLESEIKKLLQQYKITLDKIK